MIGSTRRRLLLLAGMAFTGAANSAVGADGEKVVKFQPSPGLGVWSVAVAEHGKRAVLAVGDKSLRVVDLEKFEELAKLEGHAHPAIHRVAFSPDGNHLFSCCEDGSVRQWDLKKGKEVRNFHEKKIGVKSLDVSRDGKQLLTGGLDGTLRLFEIESGKLINSFDNPEGAVGSPFRTVAIVPGADRVLASNAKGYVGVWDATTGKRVALHGPIKGEVGPVACAPDGKTFAYGTDTDGEVRICHIARGQDLQTFKGHTGAVTCLAFSADGKLVVSGGADKTVRLWDVASGKELKRLEKHEAAVSDVAITKDARRVLTGGQDGAAYVWSLVD